MTGGYLAEPGFRQKILFKIRVSRILLTKRNFRHAETFFSFGPSLYLFRETFFSFRRTGTKSRQYESVYAQNVRNLCVLEQNLKIFALRAQTRLPLQRTPTYTQPQQPCTKGFVCVSPPLPGVCVFVCVCVCLCVCVCVHAPVRVQVRVCFACE